MFERLFFRVSIVFLDLCSVSVESETHFFEVNSPLRLKQLLLDRSDPGDLQLDP